MLVEVRISVGSPDAPFASWGKSDNVYADSADQSREILLGCEAALEMLEEAKASMEKQAQAAQQTFGSGPQAGS